MVGANVPINECGQFRPRAGVTVVVPGFEGGKLIVSVDEKYYKGVAAADLGPVPMIKLEQTTQRDGDRCFRQDTYVWDAAREMP
jgi:hypothetical protein